MIVICINDEWNNFRNIPGPHPVKDGLYEVIDVQDAFCPCGCGANLGTYYALRECSVWYQFDHFREVDIDISDIEVKEEVYTKL